MSTLRFSRAALTLYVVTGAGENGALEVLEQKVEASLKGGATMIQFREKRMASNAEEMVLAAKRVKTLAERYGVPFVVNDQVDLAAAIGGCGVHLGQGDGTVAAARMRLGPQSIIGVSVHSVAEAMQAERDGADYLGAGAVFATGSKVDAQPLAHETLRAICRSVRLPVVAIGGIHEENLMALAGSGVQGVAVISAVFGQRDVAAATRRLKVLAEALVKMNDDGDKKRMRV